MHEPNKLKYGVVKVESEVKSRVLIIKMNLLPWYNELDDTLVINHSEFPELVRERIAEFGEYSIDFISRNETRLRQNPKDKDT